MSSKKYTVRGWTIASLDFPSYRSGTRNMRDTNLASLNGTWNRSSFIGGGNSVGSCKRWNYPSTDRDRPSTPIWPCANRFALQRNWRNDCEIVATKLAQIRSRSYLRLSKCYCTGMLGKMKSLLAAASRDEITQNSLSWSAQLPI